MLKLVEITQIYSVVVQLMYFCIRTDFFSLFLCVTVRENVGKEIVAQKRMSAKNWGSGSSGVKQYVY